MGRKRNTRVLEKQLLNYINEDIEVKETCRNYIFNIYLLKNDDDYEATIEHITADLITLENIEQYETCAMLNDILKDFA